MFDLNALKYIIEKYGNVDMEGYYIKYQRTENSEIEKIYIGKTQYLFLHVPKTGGTYVARSGGVLKPIFDMNHAVLVNMPYTGNPDYPPTPGYSSYMREDVTLVTKPNRLCFAAVRNPFDWFVSYWFHAGCNLDTSEHYDFPIARKGFDYFIKSIAERESGWPSKKLLYFAFFSYQGDFIIDRLIHQENLDFELDEFASEDPELIYTKSNARPRVSVGRDKDYSVYYNDNLVDLISNTWYRDLYLFGYNFYGRSTGFYDKVILSEQKNRVKYIWDTDELFVDGELFAEYN